MAIFGVILSDEAISSQLGDYLQFYKHALSDRKPYFLARSIGPAAAPGLTTLELIRPEDDIKAGKSMEFSVPSHWVIGTLSGGDFKQMGFRAA